MTKLLVAFDFDQTLTKKHFGKGTDLPSIGRAIDDSLNKKNEGHVINNFIRNRDAAEKYIKKYEEIMKELGYSEYKYVPDKKNLDENELRAYKILLANILKSEDAFEKDNYRDPDKLTAYLKELKEKYHDNITFAIITNNSALVVKEIVKEIYPGIFEPNNILESGHRNGVLVPKTNHMIDLVKSNNPTHVIYFDDDKNEIDVMNTIQSLLGHWESKITAVLVNTEVKDFPEFVKEKIDGLNLTGGRKLKRSFRKAAKSKKRTSQKLKSKKRKSQKLKSKKRKSIKKY